MRLAVLALLALIGVVWAGMSAGDRSKILYSHNIERAKIARGVFRAKGKLMPPAKNMYQLKWSNALEATAQAHANKCVFAHSTDRPIDVGENMAMALPTGNTSEGTGSVCVQMWWKEFQDVGWASLNFTQATLSTGIGHATQNAWATSRWIGCGAALCNQRVYIFCQYQTRGNAFNRMIYNQGPKCSACPAPTKCVLSGVMAGLCA